MWNDIQKSRLSIFQRFGFILIIDIKAIAMTKSNVVGHKQTPIP